MGKKRTNRRSLLMSALSLILCVSMLIGSTFAWFTDSVTSGKNIIQSGNLDIEMYWTDDLDSGSWYDVEDPNHNTIFSYDNWEPGYTDVKYIKLVNTGELALNYKLSLTPQNGVGKLAEVINVYYAEDGVAVEQRSDLKNMKAIGLLNNVLDGGATADGTLLAPGQQSPLHPNGNEIIMTLAMNMITSAGNDYQNENSGDFTVTALATQASFEKDSFGADYDSGAEYPVLLTGSTASVAVTAVNGKVPAGGVTMTGKGISAFVPEGVALASGANKLTLNVTPLANSSSNIATVNDEVLIPVDVHIDGVAEDNTVPIIIDLGEVLPKYLNMGNYHLFHVEDGNNVEMTLVDSKASLTAHNQFTYDPLTGEVTVAMASFSEVDLVADTSSPWEGGEDSDWYTEDAIAAKYFEIANADQLYAFSKIVGGIDYERNDFDGATVKLLSDINLNHGNFVDDGIQKIFYPIGYYNNQSKSERGDKATGLEGVESTVYSFSGTFDGNGNQISNFYQNSWEMFGDYNSGYSGTPNYYKDAMGLFGYVNGGTVKNLTVDHFESDGEFTPTGVIVAYADGDATFENIAITNCNPRVYNTGNGGIIGIVGDTSAANDDHITLKNITVDNSNIISALWGSYDVACGGLVGMYRGNVDASGEATGDTISFNNCHVAAQMDVYNDVCGNYQYYAYRYAGMIIGSVRHNTKNADGKTIPNMTGISATDCTVNYGTWNDYYYCEFEKNSIASYSEDYQFSRVPHSELKFTDSNGNGKIDTVEERNTVSGCKHTHTAEEDKTAVYLPFHQLFTGYSWGVSSIGLKEYSGIVTDLGITEGDQEESVVKFEKAETALGTYATGATVSIGELFKAAEITDSKLAILGSNVQVTVSPVDTNVMVSGTYIANTSDWTKGTLTFSGIGDVNVTITDYYFCTSTTIKLTIGEPKFAPVFQNVDDYIYRVGNQNTVNLGSLFGVDMGIGGLDVAFYVERVAGDVTAKYTSNVSDWTKGTIQFTGTGYVKATVSINNYNHGTTAELYLEVVDATNITSATAGTGKNFVLLKDVTYNGSYLYFKNSVLYGNGFTIDITGADHSDLKDSSDTNSNKSAYCNIWMVDSRFDNVQIKGSVYPSVGMTADSDYGNAAIRTEGDCYITNSYVSNCRVPLRVQGNTTLIDTVVDGGRYANIELRSGKLTLDGVTTINTVRKGSDETTDVIGFGIVIHSEAANASISVIGDGLKQYNWVGENEHKSTLSGDSNLSSAYKLIFNANNSDTIYFDRNSDRYVNTGILCLCADMDESVVFGLDDRYCQEVSGYDAWVLTYDNSKHSAWFDESVEIDSVAAVPAQHPVIPVYSGNSSQTVEFTKGETYNFDTSVLTAKKHGQNLQISSVKMNGTIYNYGDEIAITEGGIFEIVYTVVDPYNYNADASVSTPVSHTVSVTVTAVVKDAEILAPKFTFIDQNGNKYEATTVKAGDKTYVMPNVTAADPTTNGMSSINIGSASISGTTVYFPIAKGTTERSGSNFNRYYPLFNGINITDYTIAGDTTGTTYDTSGNYTSLVGSSGTKFIIPANGGQTNCGDYVKTDGQSGNAAGNSDSGWQGAGYSTSYGGTYLKSGNTNASSGADANGYERIVWVEYCFNAGNGDVYYYRIGYHCNKADAQTGCITPDTLITLADGSQKRVDCLTGTEDLLVWNHETGKLDRAPVAYIVDHEGHMAEREIIHLTFANGKTVKIIGEHVFFNATLNKYVAIDTNNADAFIGHTFAALDVNGTGVEKIKLVSVERTVEETLSYEVVSYKHLTCFTESVLSTSAYLDPLLNVFDVDTDSLAYSGESIQKDIETYGLYTYTDFEGLISEEAFELYNAQYLKIAVGKGYITWDDILALIDIYFNVDVQPIQ